MDDVREQLGRVEDQLRGLREEKARATKIRDSAVASAAEHLTESAANAAQAAKQGVEDVIARIDKASDVQVELLRKLGDMEAGQSGFASPNFDGWLHASRTLSLADSVLQARVS